jgi:hypothetical protein
MSEKRKSGTSLQREKNKKLLVAIDFSCHIMASMFKKIENNLMKSVVSTY